MYRIVGFCLFVFFCSCTKTSPGASRNFVATPRNKPPVRETTHRVFLDPGHGGSAFGARSKLGHHLIEKNLCLETSIKTRMLLQNFGYKVFMSRSSDIFVSLPRRVVMAKKTNADIFVSIHFNTAQNPVARGVEIFYYKDRKSFRRTSQSLELGNCIMKQLCKHLKSPSRGVRSGDFCVIRETCMPAVLVELGFLSNPIDVQRLQNSTYRQQISMAIANGIQEYFSKR